MKRMIFFIFVKVGHTQIDMLALVPTWNGTDKTVFLAFNLIVILLVPFIKGYLP